MRARMRTRAERVLPLILYAAYMLRLLRHAHVSLYYTLIFDFRFTPDTFFRHAYDACCRCYYALRC